MIDLSKYKITPNSVDPEVKSLINRNKEFAERTKQKQEEYKKEQEKKRFLEQQLKQENLQRYNQDKSNNDGIFKYKSNRNINPITNDRANKKYNQNRYSKSYAINKQHFDYANELSKDLGTIYAFKRSLGKTDKEIQEELIPKDTSIDVEKRLADIESKLKQGKEGIGYNIQEGYLEKEVMNILSQEAVKRMNGVPDKLDYVNKFLEEHPELSLDEENNNALFKGIRFLGEFTSQTKNSLIYSSKDFGAWATTAAIILGGVAVGTLTGGTALPAYVGVTSKALASMTPLMAAGFGMSYGSGKKMQEIEAGLSYNEYLQQGIHPDIAKDMAQTVGAINGVLEMVEMGTLLTWLPGASLVKDTALKNVRSEMVNKIAKTVAAYGINLSNNMLQEAAQESTTYLGGVLSEYMQNAPNPNTIDGLKLLSKTMTTDEYIKRVGDSAIAAAESMWLLPIGTGLAKAGTNQLAEAQTKLKQSKGYYTEEDTYTDAYIQEQKKILLDENSPVNILIEQANKNNPDSINYLIALEPLIEGILAREDLTNTENAQILKQYEKVKTTIEEVKNKILEENPDIQFETTFKSEIANQILNREVPFITLEKDIYIDYYKDAQELGLVDKINDLTNKGKTYSEIAEEISEIMPRGKKNVVEASVYVNAVEAINKEINARKQFNLVENANIINQVLSKQSEDVNQVVSDTEVPQVETQQIETQQAEQDEQQQTEPQQSQQAESDMIELGIETEPDMIELGTEPIVETAKPKQTTMEKAPEAVTIVNNQYKPSDIVQVPVDIIRIDQERFQFRESGTTNKFADTEWKNELSGVLLLWQDDKDGTLYVVNGHHRLLLAKENNVKLVNARILTDVTDKQARAMGALINIAEDNATAIDVAKYIKETNSTREELVKLGVPPKSKILRDGIALSKLSPTLFRKVATGSLSVENAVVIGNELPNNETAQNTIVKKIMTLEAKDKIITQDLLRSLIMIEKSAGEIEGEQINLLGEIDKRSYSYEKANIIEYVRKELKSKKRLLANVNKEQNAKILESLGNKVNIEENLKDMNSTELALYLLDKSAYYKSSVSDMFNEFAKQLAGSDSPLAVKKKALNAFVDLVESGELLNEVLGGKEQVQEIENQVSLLEAQTDLFGEQIIEEVNKDAVEVVVNKNADPKLVETLTPIIETMKINPVFNDLVIEFNGEENKVIKLTKKELEKYGYNNAEEGSYTISGYLARPRKRRNGDTSNNNKTKLVLTNSADKGTLLHEVIHYIEEKIPQINPELANLINDWSEDIYEQAQELGIEVWDKKELLANALTLSEFGYATDDIAKSNLVEVDPDIVSSFKTIVGYPFYNAIKGDKQADTNRQIKLKYRGYAERQLREATKKENIKDAKSERLQEIKDKMLKTVSGVSFYSPDSTKQIFISDVDEDGKHNYIIFDNNEEIDSDTKTTDEILDLIRKQDLIYDKQEIQEELNQYNREEINKIFADSNAFNFDNILSSIKNGNITAKDYDLILSNIVDNTQANVLIDEIRKAYLKGLNTPNDKITMTQFLNRFYEDGINDTIKIILNEDNKYSIVKVNFENQDMLVSTTALGVYDNLQSAIEQYLNQLVTEKNLDNYKKVYKRFKDDITYIRSNNNEHSKYIIRNSFANEVDLAKMDNFVKVYPVPQLNATRNNIFKTLTEYTKEKNGALPVYIDASKTITYEDVQKNYVKTTDLTNKLLEDGYTAVINNGNIIPLSPVHVYPTDYTIMYENANIGSEQLLVGKNIAIVPDGFSRTLLIDNNIYKYNIRAKEEVGLSEIVKFETPIYIENLPELTKQQKAQIVELEKLLHKTIFLDGKRYTSKFTAEDVARNQNTYVIDPNSVVLSYSTSVDLIKKFVELGGIPAPTISISNANDIVDVNKNNIIFLFKQDTIDPDVNADATIYTNEVFTRDFPVRVPEDLTGVLTKVDEYLINRTNNPDLASKLLPNFIDIQDLSIEKYINLYANEPLVKYVYAVDKGIYQFDKAILKPIKTLNEKNKSMLIKTIKDMTDGISKEDVAMWLKELVIDNDDRQYMNNIVNFKDPAVKSYIAELKSDNLLKLFAKTPKPDIYTNTIDIALLKSFYANKFESFADMVKHKKNLVNSSKYNLELMKHTKKIEKLVDKLLKENKQNIQRYLQADKNPIYNSVHEQLQDPEQYVRDNFIKLIAKYFSDTKSTSLAKFNIYYEKDITGTLDARTGFRLAKIKFSPDIIAELDSILSDIEDVAISAKFEATTERLVPFSEVAVAIVPDNISPEVVKYLKMNGVKSVMPYSLKENQSYKSIRQSLAKAVLEDGEILYQIKKASVEEKIKEYGDKLIKNKDGNPSTLNIKNKNGEEIRYNYFIKAEKPLEFTNKTLFNETTKQYLIDNGYDAAILRDANGDVINAKVLSEEQLIMADPVDALDVNGLDEFYHMKYTEDTRERGWANTIRTSGITEQWIVDLLTNEKMMYEIKHNRDTMLRAAQILQEKGINYVESVLESDMEATAEIMAAGELLVEYYRTNGNESELYHAIELVAQNATNAGQAIQILSQFGKLTASGKVKFVKRELDKIRVPKLDKQLENKTTELKEKAKEIIENQVSFDELNNKFDEILDKVGEAEEVEKVFKNLTGEQQEFNLDDIVSGKVPEEIKKRAKQNRTGRGRPREYITNPEAIINNKDKIIETIKKHYLEPDNKNLYLKLKKLGLTDIQAKVINRYVKDYVRYSSEKKLLAAIEDMGKSDEMINKSILNTILEGDFGDGLKADLARKLRIPFLPKELVDHIYKISSIIEKMPEGKAKDIETAKLIRDINEYLPVTLGRKISTLQIISLLLNGITTLRNMLSNRWFRILDTMVLQFIGTPIDMLASMKTKKRTVVFRPISIYNDQRRYYKKELPNAVMEQILGIDTYAIDDKFNTGIDIGDLSHLAIKRTFGRNTILGKLETATNVLMRSTDRAAFAATFYSALDDLMTLNEVVTPTDEMIETASALALYRTFNDNTKLAEGLKTIKKGMNMLGTRDRQFGLGNLVLTFPKTPANILMRGIDYSPIGLFITTMKLWRDTTGDEYVKQRLAVEGYSRAIAGTGLIGIGMTLYTMGIITSGSPPDEQKRVQEFKQSIGLRGYSVNVNAILRHLSGEENAGEIRPGDKLYSYDWLQPIAFPLAIGADIASGQSTALSVADNIIKAFEAGVNVFTDQPFFTGLQRLFGYNDIAGGLAETVKSAPSSFVPSLMGQAARFVDPRSTDPYSMYTRPEQTVNLVKNKVVGARNTLPQRISPLGEGIRYYSEDEAIFSRFIRSFFSPAIITEYEPSKEAEFILDLYEDVKDPEIVPKKPQKQYTLTLSNKEKVVIKPTPEEWEEWQRILGTKNSQDIKYIMNNFSGRLTKEELADEIKKAMRENEKELKEMLINQVESGKR